MNLEYFYQLIQLFGVLLGLIGIFIIYKIQSIDININTTRNNIVTSIAQYKAVKDKSVNDLRKLKSYDELVLYNCFIINASQDDDLLHKLDVIIDEQIEELGVVKLYLKTKKDEWNDLKLNKG